MWYGVLMDSTWSLRGVSMESSWSPCRLFVDSTESSWTPWKPVGECKVLAICCVDNLDKKVCTPFQDCVTYLAKNKHHEASHTTYQNQNGPASREPGETGFRIYPQCGES